MRYSGLNGQCESLGFCTTAVRRLSVFRESRDCGSGVERNAAEERFAARRSVKSKNRGGQEDEKDEKCRFRVPRRNMRGQKIPTQDRVGTKSCYKREDPKAN